MTGFRRPFAGALLMMLAASAMAAEAPIEQPGWTDKKADDAPKPKREFFVGPRGDDAAKGTSRETSWKTLQVALCRLKPGDHLTMLEGEYAGPISVAEPCVDGKPKQPIQVTAVKDAVLMGSQGDEPVLRIARSHWRINGLELIGDWAPGPALAIDGPSRGVQFIHGHVHNGIGTGILIGKGATDVKVSHTHVHHLGEARGGPRKRGGPNKEGNPRAKSTSNLVGIAVHAGAGPVFLVANNVHSIMGKALDLDPKAKVNATDNDIQDNPPTD